MVEVNVRDNRLLPLWEKVREGERLTFEDGLLLFETDDLVGLGQDRAGPSSRTDQLNRDLCPAFHDSHNCACVL